MAELVSKLLSKLRFEGGPVETLYLDETRVHEDFIGQVGAIGSFTRLGTMEGKAGLEMPVLKIEVEGSPEASVTWNLSHPIVQVLVLRAVLQSQGSLNGLDGTKPGCYVIFSGTGMISRPGMFENLHRERLQGFPDLYEKLEAERAMQERDVRETDQVQVRLRPLRPVRHHHRGRAAADPVDHHHPPWPTYRCGRARAPAVSRGAQHAT